ncbi:TIGR04197 family type VII secretion effector [Streptococcus oricebi]|uniref:TIGR04197 family type VII secretion effector n=1 Tax=Streptococcus oricebi TaxID=1547447 RepID=A0ABS5B1A0_9STRE|nr:TIGR04197 family type VII secretion effector [Streptococcus oricebi]MBP2622607.1 TIGR04197 family type VII secretion effector [Streptococcus oricebi]
MSVEIKSDASIASQHATALINSLASLKVDATIKDETSVLQGNEKAKEVIDKSDSLAADFMSDLSTFQQLVQTTAADFQVVDEQLSTGIQVGD